MFQVYRVEILPMVRDILYESPMVEQPCFDRIPSNFQDQMEELEPLESAHRCSPEILLRLGQINVFIDQRKLPASLSC